MPKQKTMIYVAVVMVFAALSFQLYRAHAQLDAVYSAAETGYDVGGPYATSRNQPKELDEEYKQFAWSRFEQDEPTVEGMSGHWALSCPASLTSYSGFWKETGEPNTFELYDIADRSHVGSIHLYFAGSHTDGRIWLEFNDEHMFLYEMGK